MIFRTLPPFGGDQRAVAEIVRGIMDGKTNNTGTVTLNTGNATTTTITDARIGVESKIILVPYSAAAYADVAPYGEFHNDTDQAAPSAGSSAVVVWDHADEANGVYLSNSTRVNVRNAGVYNVAFSLQLQNAANDGQYADVWIRKNGSDVTDTARRYYIPPRKSSTEFSHVVGTAQYIIELAANDYIEVAGSVSSTDVTLEHFPADAGIPRPAIPAAVLCVNLDGIRSSGGVYVSAVTNGSATISHFANDTADKTYGYVVVG